MKPARNIVTTATLFLLALALLGCATLRKPTRERPQWTMHGDGLFIGPGRVLYGVGIYPGSKKGAAWSYSGAENRARAVLGRFAENFGKTMLNTRKEDERKHAMMRSAEEQDGQFWCDLEHCFELKSVKMGGWYGW